MVDPAPQGRSSLLVRIVERWLGRAASWSHAHPWRVTALVGAATAVATIGIVRLKVDADLIELLPDSFQSVQDVERLKQRFGGVGYLVVVAGGAEPEALQRFADDFAPKLEALPTVKYVLAKRPTRFFEDRALYYMGLKDLRTVASRLRTRIAWERRTANPLFIDFEEEEKPSVAFADIEARYRQRGDHAWIERQTSEEYYLDRSQKMLALLVKPEGLSADLSFVRRLVADVEQLVDTQDLSLYGTELRVDLSGRFKKRLDTQSLMESDLMTTSWVALGLVLVYLLVHFRRLWAVALIVLPLLIGLAWSYGFAAFTFGVLNILTAFIGAILIGLGIDHGIHLLGRYESEIAHGATPAVAVQSAFTHTGRAVVVAALTTSVGFLGIAVSEFRAFREFGLVAAMGIMLLVAAYTLCLPALLGVLGRHGWKPRPVPLGARLPLLAVIQRYPRSLAIGCLAAAALATLAIPAGRFNYDFSALEATFALSYRLDTQVNRLLGYSQTPVAVLTDSVSEEREIAAAIRAQKEQLGPRSTIDFVASTADLIPEGQIEKQRVLQDITDLLDQLPMAKLDPDQRQRLRRARRLAKALPFGNDSLPLEVRRQFSDQRQGRSGGFVLVFPSIRLSDGMRVGEFAQELRGLELAGGKRIHAAGEAMVLADIIEMVRQEAPPVLALTLVGVFLTLWLLCGRLGIALICLATGLGTLLVLLGLLPLADVRLNYLNIIMIPILFGIAIDGGVHLALRFQRQQLDRGFSEVGRAVAGSVLTTGLGFGALLLAHHNGLNSLGKVAVIGLAINIVACLMALPACLQWRWLASGSPKPTVTEREPQANVHEALR